MDTDLLKYDKQIVKFPNLEITAGITSNVMGSFRSDDSDSENRIKRLKAITNTSYYGQLIPNHNTEISKFSVERHDQTASGDAVIYGNKQIGYIVIIHCSWITLAKEIIYLTLKRLHDTEFCDFGKLQAFIYPGICQSCYEVGPDVREKLMSGNIYQNPYFQFLSKNKWLFNLSSKIRSTLISNMIKPEYIQTISSCSAHTRFPVDGSVVEDNYVLYSHRARQDTARNAIFTKLPEDDKVILTTTGDCPYVILYALPD